MRSDFSSHAPSATMAATTNALGVTAELDYCADPTLLYFPGASYAGHQTVMGQVAALRANAECLGGGTVTAGMRSNGESPAVTFAKHVRQSMVVGRNVVIVQAAVSSISLAGTAGGVESGGEQDGWPQWPYLCPIVLPDGVHATAQSNRWLDHAMAERFLAAQ